jgi:hypothetical protein
VRISRKALCRNSTASTAIAQRLAMLTERIAEGVSAIGVSVPERRVRAPHLLSLGFKKLAFSVAHRASLGWAQKLALPTPRSNLEKVEVVAEDGILAFGCPTRDALCSLPIGTETGSQELGGKRVPKSRQQP